MEKLAEAEAGFYFVDSDEAENQQLMRGFDFRNKKVRGICLILASTFQTKTQFMQACGRVRRASDEGSIFTLQKRMYNEEWKLVDVGDFGCPVYQWILASLFTDVEMMAEKTKNMPPVGSIAEPAS